MTEESRTIIPQTINGFAYWLEGTKPDTIRFAEVETYEKELELDLPVPAFPTEMSSRVKAESYSSEAIINEWDDLGREMRLTVDNEYIFHYSCGYDDDQWYEDTLHLSAADYQYLVAHRLRINGIGGIHPGDKPQITARSIDVNDQELQLGIHAAQGVHTTILDGENFATVANLTAEQMQAGTQLDLPKSGRYYIMYDGVNASNIAGDSIRMLTIQTQLPQPLEVREPGSLDELLWFTSREPITTFALTGDLNAADFAVIRETMPAIEELSLPATLTAVPAGAFSTMGSHLLVLDWNSKVPVSAAAFDSPEQMQNLMVYAPAAVSSDYQGNLVIGNRAEQITLYDELPVRIPREFTAGEVSYTRHFDMESSRQNKPAGWESIVLPFDVQHFESEERGRLAPFGADDADSHPFWLAQLNTSANNFVLAATLEANKPYILLMPNNPSLYADEYNITGDVRFSASEAWIHRTQDAQAAVGQRYDLVPTYESLAQHDTIYTLNRVAYDSHLPGGAFVRNLRDAVPFEAYLRSHNPASAPAVVAIETGADESTAIQRILREGVHFTGNGLLIYDEAGVLYVVSPYSSAIQVPLYTVDGRMLRMLTIQPGTNRVEDLPKSIYVIARQKINIR